MGLDIKNRLYVVTNMPSDLDTKDVCTNKYLFFGKNTQAYVQEHYEGDELVMSYMVYEGVRAVLSVVGKKELLDRHEDCEILTDKVTRLDTGTALVYFSTIRDLTYISKISVYDANTKDLELPEGIVVNPVDRPLDIPYSVYRGDSI